MLKDLQRVVDEVALGYQGDAEAFKGASLILEQVSGAMAVQQGLRADS